MRSSLRTSKRGGKPPLSERRSGFTQMRTQLPALLLSAVLLLIWQLGAAAVNLPHLFPSPAAILVRTWELRESLILHHLPVTLYTVIAGWGLAIAIALFLAVLMHVSERAEACIYPALVVTQTIPVMCISPLFVLWFGYTQAARLTAVVLSTFFAITLNTFEGLRRTDREKVELMRSLGATRGQIFRYVEVPSALPLLLTGLKMTLPWAVIDAAVAEWLGATQGLGYFSKRMISKMDGPAVFAPILVLTVFVLIEMAVLNAIDRKAAFYRNEL
ncbi:MAG: ABC transporter permease [Lachnospiraceae bacterium]|nr:ABC transporter permease [Lachnospiraceae bacterium]